MTSSDDPSSEPGWIIYLKASYFTSAMPIDVRAYGETNLEFPNESTMNQWFKESQFESYRKLGYFLAARLGKPQQRYTDLASFFGDVCDATIAVRSV